MLDWLQQLQPRERLTLIAGAIALSLILFYFLLWTPLQTERQQLQTTVQVLQQDWQWMQQAAATIQQLQQQPTATRRPTQSQESLLGLLDRLTRQGNFAALEKRLEPQSDNNVRIDFQRINVNDLMQWLAQLDQQHVVVVQQMTLEPTEQPAQIKARLTLSR